MALLQDQLFTKFKFRVTFVGPALSKIGQGLAHETDFSEVRGLKTGMNATDMTTIRTSVSRLPTHRMAGNLVLKRGLVKNTVIRKWVSDAVEKSLFYPLDVQISLLDPKNQPAMTWTVHNAWPISLEIDDLNASSNEVLHETLTLSYATIQFHA